MSQSTDFWSAIAGALDLKQYPLVFLCLLWVFDLRKQLRERERIIESLNLKIREDIVPLLTRLLDLVPELLAQVRRRK